MSPASPQQQLSKHHQDTNLDRISPIREKDPVNTGNGQGGRSTTIKHQATATGGHEPTTTAETRAPTVLQRPYRTTTIFPTLNAQRLCRITGQSSAQRRCTQDESVSTVFLACICRMLALVHRKDGDENLSGGNSLPYNDEPLPRRVDFNMYVKILIDLSGIRSCVR